MRKGLIGMFLASCIMLSFCFPFAAAAGIDDSAAITDTPAREQVLSDEKIDRSYARGGIAVPAHTTVYLAQADILSYVEISIDCAEELCYGICTWDGGTTIRLETQTDDICSGDTFAPDEAGSYYIYLCNKTDEDISADVVVRTGEWIEHIKEYAAKHAIRMSSRS